MLKLIYSCVIFLLTVLNTFSFKPIFQTKISSHFKPYALTAERSSIKEDLLRKFDGSVEPLYVCPTSLNSLYKVIRYYGLVKEEYYYDKQNNKKYYINPNGQYLDLTISSEQSSKPFFSLSLNELIGQRFFQVRLDIE